MANNKHGMKSFRLYQGNRKIELHDKTKRDIPGPGTYRVPSDFGFYEDVPVVPLSARVHAQRKTKSFAKTTSTNLMQANIR